ncbi:hypothetical protein OKW50_004752 [Paraburkholderia youngii]
MFQLNDPSRIDAQATALYGGTTSLLTNTHGPGGD